MQNPAETAPSVPSSAPRSTYRIQVREGFPLKATADLVDYLDQLGVEAVYLSPLLAAEPGSDHGYDVVDHSKIDDARGGAEGLAAVATAAHSAGLGVIADIVPNHVGVATPADSVWWWDVLENGRGSRYAEAFDIDWDFGDGRLRIPVLGDDEGDGNGTPGLSIIDGQLDHFGTRYPIAAGTNDDRAGADTVHSRQHYELVNWRRADADLNYRRFFAVNTLAAIRVELPWVFEESHAEILRWVRDGLIDGLRVDHPDGLLDPGGYLDDLAAATEHLPVLVEKILEGHERLPGHWQTTGTTGYDALADVDRVLVDPSGRDALDDLERSLTDGDIPTWADRIHDTKLGIATGILRSEILRITRLLPDLPDAEATVAEIAACFPVYRSYLPHGADTLAAAAAEVHRRRPELGSTLDALLPLLSDPAHPAAARLQQTTGMVMAKGVEDTAFYRYSRLVSLNEVGCSPDEFSIAVDEFHHRQETRQAVAPVSMTALSTHDTKRGEDVRARIDVIAELPDVWRATIERLRELAPVGDGPFENLLWQSVVGAWPASRARLHAYAEKASREANSSTTWTAPNEEFEGRMHAAIDAAFDDPEVAKTIEHIVDRLSAPGWSNSLSAKLIQLTIPGSPDVYQGSELWETSLVDPDNRREVDFDLRRLLLTAIEGGARPTVDETGAAKLLVTTRALHLRRDHPELFSRYAGLSVIGEAADHLVAFDRGGAITLATRLPVGLEARGGWGSTTVLLPRRSYVDVLTGTPTNGGTVRVADLLTDYPVALLEARE